MKKISLNKETIRRLDDHELKRANGGKPISCMTLMTIPPTTLCTRLCDTIICESVNPCPPADPGPPATKGC